ncbi:hypothetical protein ACJU26_08695 [Acidithiobacillus sp. M4-SHS-6]|uniref:hypothetical protein n=1 Tax=Acidithiobacillus sp. M4-SHS-6 TaxID=3383024 RepID=UPI0039BDD4AB
MITEDKMVIDKLGRICDADWVADEMAFLLKQLETLPKPVLPVHTLQELETNLCLESLQTRLRKNLAQLELLGHDFPNTER